MSYFLKSIFYKQYYFPMFGNNFKLVEKQSPNFPYLACYKIKLFSKNN